MNCGSMAAGSSLERVFPEILNLHLPRKRDSVLKGSWERVVGNSILAFLQGMRCEFCGQKPRVAPAVTERHVFPMQPMRFQNINGIASGRVQAQIEDSSG